ncbi:RHS repeat domain-containing protein [Dactylosporangium sp. NPDC051541]|uniref:RHS repeat domain-containing protein n=1 Tax=Dactylosporangium sp. NPDC051541 TaxID=3363977 RepID=UPI0037A2A724
MARAQMWPAAGFCRLARSRLTRTVAFALPITLALTVVGDGPVMAGPKRDTPPAVQKLASVPVKTVTGTAGVPDPAVAAAAHKPPAARFPAAATGVVDLGGAVATETLRSGSAAKGPKASAIPVYFQPLASTAAQTVAGVQGAAPASVAVSLYGQDTAARAAGKGIVLRLARRDGGVAAGPLRVSLDYGAFQSAYGADWSSRLTFLALPECALSTPGAPGCQGTPVRTVNDLNHSLLTADVAVPGAAPSTAHSPAAADAAARTAGLLLAAVSTPSGGAGDFAATSLQASGTWQAGSSSGDFAWSYPMRVPPAIGGPAPALGLAYSSQSVDGRNEASNNQPSWVGEGFETTVGGFIERRYRACADDMGSGANNADETGDQCWATDNATLSLSGHAGELLYNSGDGTWHLRKDDGTRVVKLTGAAGTDNGTYNREYWKVTTLDGTQYFFGLNRIPGWTAGRPETNSAATVPVAGNNAGEPCHASAFKSSFCQQGYRWSLDYVKDIHGNSMSYWYTKETNQYAKAADPDVLASYDRGVFLNRADYGTRGDAEFGTAPFQVRFDHADRCESNCATHDGDHWTDTPWDMECTATPCHVGSPTFWSTQRLSAVTTSVWGGSAYRDVDSWTLHQTYPDPGDHTRAGLWLSAITHSGLVGGTKTLPDVKFAGIQLNNRVDTSSDGKPAMNWWRVHTITNESGGDVTVDYSDRECVTGSHMPASPDTNTMRCMPVKGDFPGQPDRIDWFHKYVVTAVIETDHSGASKQHIVSKYKYTGTAAWHFADDDGLVKPKDKTWSVWRGYDRVQVLRGDAVLDPGRQTLVETLFYQGMDGDRRADDTTRHVSVQASEGPAVPDSDWYAGMPRETLSYDTVTNTVVGGSIQDAWVSNPTATRTINGFTVDSRFVNTSGVRTRILLDGNRGWMRGEAKTTFNDYGLPVTMENTGDQAVADDTRCTRYTYTPNTDPNVWLLATLSEVRIDALACSSQPASAADVIDDTRSVYDEQAFGATPTKGDKTSEQILSKWQSGGSPEYFTTGVWKYDGYGRVVESTDSLQHKTTTEYTPKVGGPVTQIKTIDPKLFTTTVTSEPAWGQPLTTLDANDKQTDVTYDPLGRIAQGWQPGYSKAAHPTQPNASFDYDYHTDKPTVVTSRKLNAAGNYVTAYTFYDSFLRERQTQSTSPVATGGRIIADTFYDSLGRANLTYGAYYNSAAAGPALVEPADAALVPTQTATIYDGAGRPTASVFQPGGVERFRSTTKYGGDRTDYLPPLGTSAHSVVTDIGGRTVALRQYHGNTISGSPDVTLYGYNRQGLLEKVTDPSGNIWKTVYDVRGRVSETQDPDKGKTTFGYDDGDELTRVTLGVDTTGQKSLAYKYDELGRVTGVYDGVDTTGHQRAGWTYDTLAKGQLTSSSRFDDNNNEYKSAVTGLNDQYQPTGTAVTIPSVEGAKLAGTYSFAASYNGIDGSPASVSYPSAGGLGAETVQFTYDTALGVPKTTKTTYGGVASTYVADTTYSELGRLLQVKLSTGTGGSLYESYTYETDTGRLQNAKVLRTQVSPNTITDTTYKYDDSGNVIKLVDAPAGGTTDTQCFQQDYLGRLTEAWTPASGNCTTAPSATALGGPAPYWQSFEYYLSGDRKKRTDHAPTGTVTTTNYTVKGPGAAHPHELTSTSTTQTGSSTTQTANYGYDDLGNLTSRPGTTAGSTQNLTWDVEGHLTQVSEPGKTTSFVYDASGNRLVRRDGTATTLYLGSMELRLDKATDTVSCTRYYAGPNGAVAVRTKAGLTWIATDPAGTSYVQVNATTQQAKVQRRTPFGAPRGSALSGWIGEKSFVGGDDDAATGLEHVGARYYDANLGRFISVDPVLDIGDPQQMNGYAYAGNNPINRADPTGLRDWNAIFHEIEVFTFMLMVFGVCEAAVGAAGGIFGAMVCGGVAQVAVYMAEVLAGNKKFSMDDLMKEFFTGMMWALGGEIAGQFIGMALRYGARLIRWIGSKCFGKGAEAIADDMGKLAKEKDPYGGDPAGEGGGSTADEYQKNKRTGGSDPNAKPGDPVTTEIPAETQSGGSAETSVGGDGVRGGTGGANGDVTYKLPRTPRQRAQINPNGYRNNCGQSSLAGESRWAGNESATAKGRGAMTVSDMERATGWKAPRRRSTFDAVLDEVKSWGDGGRGIIGGFPDEGMGHWFNVRNQGGVVWFYDFQIGSAAGHATTWDKYTIFRMK